VGLPFAPTLDRTFATTDRLRLFAAVRRAKGTGTLLAAVTVADEAGSTRWRDDVALSPDANGVAALDAAVPVETLGAGRYDLRVEIGDGAASRAIRFEVR
jgi:hypothetical protein